MKLLVFAFKFPQQGMLEHIAAGIHGHHRPSRRLFDHRKFAGGFRHEPSQPFRRSEPRSSSVCAAGDQWNMIGILQNFSLRAMVQDDDKKAVLLLSTMDKTFFSRS